MPQLEVSPQRYSATDLSIEACVRHVASNWWLRQTRSRATMDSDAACDPFWIKYVSSMNTRYARRISMSRSWADPTLWNAEQVEVSDRCGLLPLLYPMNLAVCSPPTIRLTLLQLFQISNALLPFSASRFSSRTCQMLTVASIR